MFTIIKNKYIRCLLGIFVFMFITLSAYKSFASVCFLPTCEEEGLLGIDTSDTIESWSKCHNSKTECEKSGNKCELVDGQYCPKSNTDDEEEDDVNNNEETCTTSCQETDHVSCKKVSEDCYDVAKDCGRNYLNSTNCSNNNNGVECIQDDNGCYYAQNVGRICPDVDNAYTDKDECERLNQETTCIQYSEEWANCYKEVPCTTSNNTCSQCINNGKCENNCPINYSLNCIDSDIIKCEEHDIIKDCKKQSCNASNNWISTQPGEENTYEESNGCYRITGCNEDNGYYTDCPEGVECSKINGCYKVSGCEPGYETSCPEGKACTEIKGCYQVTGCDEEHGYYATCPDNITCEVINGCYKKFEDSKKTCPADKICFDFNYTCAGETCSYSFLNEYSLNDFPATLILEWVEFLDTDSGDYSIYDYDFPWPYVFTSMNDKKIEINSDNVFNLNFAKNSIKPKRFELDVTDFENNKQMGFHFRLNPFSNSRGVDSISANDTTDTSNNVFIQLTKRNDSFYLSLTPDVNLDKSTVDSNKISENIIDININLTMNEDTFYDDDNGGNYGSDCKIEDNANIVITANCLDMSKSDCQIFEPDKSTLAYVTAQSLVHTCEELNKLGCISPKLKLSDGSVDDKPYIYPVYTDGEKEYVMLDDDKWYLANDFTQKVDSIDNALKPTDKFKYIFYCGLMSNDGVLSQQISISPLKTSYVSSNSVPYAFYREYVFANTNSGSASNKEITIPIVEALDTNGSVGFSLTAKPVIHREERSFVYYDGLDSAPNGTVFGIIDEGSPYKAYTALVINNSYGFSEEYIKKNVYSDYDTYTMNYIKFNSKVPTFLGIPDYIYSEGQVYADDLISGYYANDLMYIDTNKDVSIDVGNSVLGGTGGITSSSSKIKLKLSNCYFTENNGTIKRREILSSNFPVNSIYINYPEPGKVFGTIYPLASMVYMEGGRIGSHCKSSGWCQQGGVVAIGYTVNNLYEEAENVVTEQYFCPMGNNSISNFEFTPFVF